MNTAWGNVSTTHYGRRIIPSIAVHRISAQRNHLPLGGRQHRSAVSKTPIKASMKHETPFPTAILASTGALYSSQFILPLPALSAALEDRAASSLPILAQFQQLNHSVDRYTLYMSLLALFYGVTLATTCRFLLSFFPELEKKATESDSPLLLRACVSLDSLFAPAQRDLFLMKEPGDVNYAAILYLAAISAVLELLFGFRGGFLTPTVPDSDLLYSLNYLIFFQRMLLLPQWGLTVFRWFGII